MATSRAAFQPRAVRPFASLHLYIKNSHTIVGFCFHPRRNTSKRFFVCSTQLVSQWIPYDRWVWQHRTWGELRPLRLGNFARSTPFGKEIFVSPCGTTTNLSFQNSGQWTQGELRLFSIFNEADGIDAHIPCVGHSDCLKPSLPIIGWSHEVQKLVAEAANEKG